MIEEFNGSVKHLNIYIKKTDLLWKNIPNDVNRLYNQRFFMVILQHKLTGRAVHILENNDFDDWPTLKLALQNEAKAQIAIRIDEAEFHLENAIQKPNESELEFAERISEIRDDLRLYYRISPDEPQLEAMLDKKIRRSFGNGLSNPELRDRVLKRGCESFNETVKYVVDQLSKIPFKETSNQCDNYYEISEQKTKCQQNQKLNTFNYSTSYIPRREMKKNAVEDVISTSEIQNDETYYNVVRNEFYPITTNLFQRKISCEAQGKFPIICNFQLY